MIVLLNQYKKSRKELRGMLAELLTKENDIVDQVTELDKKDENRELLMDELDLVRNDKSQVNSMIISTSDIIDWIETGKNPYYQQGVDVNNAYHVQYLSNMDIIPDITERLEDRPFPNLSNKERKQLLEIFKVLSDRERDCYILHEGQGLSMSQVGDNLGISKDSVNTYVRRAREKIKSIL